MTNTQTMNRTLPVSGIPASMMIAAHSSLPSKRLKSGAGRSLYPMNVDLDKFKKLKADWLKNRATAANYKKASKEFKSIRIKPIEAQTANDYDWQAVCESQRYVMELKIFKHLPDDEWSKYEAEPPAWMGPEVSGTYPYIDQVKFTAYTFRPVHSFCQRAKNGPRQLALGQGFSSQFHDKSCQCRADKRFQPLRSFDRSSQAAY